MNRAAQVQPNEQEAKHKTKCQRNRETTYRIAGKDTQKDKALTGKARAQNYHCEGSIPNITQHRRKRTRKKTKTIHHELRKHHSTIPSSSRSIRDDPSGAGAIGGASSTRGAGEETAGGGASGSAMAAPVGGKVRHIKFL